MKRFTQVDVFTDEMTRGNPVAVVHDADDLTDEQMAAFARWTNLSETTFLLSPTQDGADYRLRIFTPGSELPFAGHPTLGSARAWLEAGNTPRTAGQLVQECAAGLIDIRQDGGRLAFAAPELLREGPIECKTQARIAQALGIAPNDILLANWVDNGPGWIGIMLATADTVLALNPDFATMDDFAVGVIAPDTHESSPTYVTRAFAPGHGVNEDPVTGSLAAGFARWLIGEEIVPKSYTVHQGAALDRHGVIHIDRDAEGTIWVGGDTVIGISGEVAL